MKQVELNLKPAPSPARSCKPSIAQRCLPATKADLARMEERINMKLSDLNENLSALRDAVKASNAALADKLAKLEQQLSNTEIPADAQATLDDLKTQVAAEGALAAS